MLLQRLDGDGNIKVGDFGLAEDVYIRGYFRQDKYDAIKVPFRWMAPESLRDGLFSEKSDIVSFLQVQWLDSSSLLRMQLYEL